MLRRFEALLDPTAGAPAPPPNAGLVRFYWFYIRQVRGLTAALFVFGGLTAVLDTMIPAFIVVALGADATRSLVISQVVLSLALPVPMIALLWLSRNRKIMGAMVASPLTMCVATAATAITLGLNALLLAETFGLHLIA